VVRETEAARRKNGGKKNVYEHLRFAIIEGGQVSGQFHVLDIVQEAAI
jgi:hypothetical protein